MVPSERQRTARSGALERTRLRARLDDVDAALLEQVAELLDREHPLARRDRHLPSAL
jgi:hypothetical protein